MIHKFTTQNGAVETWSQGIEVPRSPMQISSGKYPQIYKFAYFHHEHKYLLANCRYLLLLWSNMSDNLRKSSKP
jgi:hypothetical protein